MPSVNARTQAGALPDTQRTSGWGQLTNVLATLRENTKAAWYDTWRGVPLVCIVSGPPCGPPPPRDGRVGDPVGLGDVRSSPVLRQGPEPEALDRTGGDRENRAGMPADARAMNPGWLFAGVVLVGAALALGRR